MDQAKRQLLNNLSLNSAAARELMALSIDSLSNLTGLPVAELLAIENGCTETQKGLDELVYLALCLGLTPKGELRARPIGINYKI